MMSSFLNCNDSFLHIFSQLFTVGIALEQLRDILEPSCFLETVSFDRDMSAPCRSSENKKPIKRNVSLLFHFNYVKVEYFSHCIQNMTDFFYELHFIFLNIFFQISQRSQHIYLVQGHSKTTKTSSCYPLEKINKTVYSKQQQEGLTQ